MLQHNKNIIKIMLQPNFYSKKTMLQHNFQTGTASFYQSAFFTNMTNVIFILIIKT